MDDFGFGESDEVQDFLAREQQQFAQLNGDLNTEAGAVDGGFGLNDEFAVSNSAVDSAQANYDVDFGSQQEAFGDSSTVNFDSSSAPTMDPYSAVSAVDVQRAEPESIKKWRAEQAERLAEMDSIEQTQINEWKQQARHELDEWYKQYQEQIGKNKNNNRVAEEEMMKTIEVSNTNDGSSWSRIADMCDFNHKNHKATKDVSRMRALLINLKQHPPANAPPTQA